MLVSRKRLKECFLNQKIKLSLAILPIICTLHFAHASELNIPYLYTVEKYQWRPINTQMSKGKYQAVIRQHQQIALKNSVKHLEDKLISTGIPDRSIYIARAAIGFAADGVKLQLSNKNSIAFELKNVLYHDPTLLFKVNFDW